MICQDFRVYFNKQMSSSKISHTIIIIIIIIIIY